jgi:ABC-type multidrug transport system fused ATPase/permease subunit
LFGELRGSHWLAFLALAIVSTLGALAIAAQPLMLAPALDATLVSGPAAAGSLRDLTLNNLGPTLLVGLGLPVDERRFTIVLTASGLYLFAVVLASILTFTSLQLMRWIRTGIANDLQSRVYRHMLGLSMPFFVSHRAGDLTNRFIYDIVQTAGGFDPVMKAVFEALPQILFYSVMLMRTDPGLALAVAAVALLHLVITRVLKDQIRKRTKDSFDAYGLVGSMVQEAVVGIRIVKSFSAERFEHARLDAVLARLQTIVLKFGFYANSEQPLRDVANALAVVTALLVAFSALAEGRLTTTGLVLFVVVTRQAIAPLAQIGTGYVQFQSMLGASQRVREILAAQPAVGDGTKDAPRLQSSIEIRKVSFSYEPGKPVLRNIDLVIPRGSVVAIVGASGSGKSTLTDLVLRLADPTHGAVTWDGVDIRDFKQADYRRHFGVVSQEPLLFNASIEENIAYGRPIDAEAVRRAARLANAEEFILSFSEGFQTQVGDRGIRLSGGQRQRVAIARAVYADPDVLILDEATSALDSEAERQVQAAIDRSIAGSTALVVAHRLSTVRRADRIVVLENGAVESSGTHAELMEKSPVYRRLNELQFQGEP